MALRSSERSRRTQARTHSATRPRLKTASSRGGRRGTSRRASWVGETAADWDLVVHTQVDTVERTAPSGKRLLRRAYDQVPPVKRELADPLTRPLDDCLRCLAGLDLQIEIECQRENVKTRSEVGRRGRHPDRGGLRHYSLKASCSAATASFTRSASMMQVIRTSEVEIISMLMRRSASARNIVAATPGWPRMPLATTETLASPFCDSTVRAPMSLATP